MTSVVDTSVKFFNSTMAGAPALTGAAGSLVALLDACLKDGFDIKTLSSLVVSGGVATATYTGAHSAVQDSVIQIAGVTGTLVALNGEQKVTSKSVTAGTVTFATNAPDGIASGTITMKMAPAGWLKLFGSTNPAVYKSSDPVASGCCLRVDDTATLFARVVGYESMSDASNGIGPFPTPAQMSGGGYWPKSIQVAGNVDWYLFADSRMFYFAPVPGRSQSNGFLCGTLRGFGDIVSYKPSGDPFACVLSFSTNSSVAGQFDGSLSNSPNSQIAMPRAFTGVGSAVFHYTWAPIGASAGISGLTNSAGPFPNPVDGSLTMVRRHLSPTGQNYARGELPGYMHIPQSSVYDTFKPGDQVVGTGQFAGRRFVAFTVSSEFAFNNTATNSNVSLGLMDTTGPWR
ncbi:hypothetical protein J2W28_000227 [Variovorax boronicumulans]|uniref:hypothetical protein n=1 Tax=Variovorax boronicumulans TaxID=436515 RepID=UPI002784F9BA|nr:hypothetical protein [Variovorax boronicumulans]MDP9990390.1 hypothetical protein [Variovorax boronicumulans]MDQ0001099.1 hypothetical protein [Variovorax boronicumulans]